MKNISIFIINFYHNFLSTFLKQILGQSKFCRFTPCCCEYTKAKIEKHGALIGLKLGLVRFLHCQPFSNKTLELDLKI